MMRNGELVLSYQGARQPVLILLRGDNGIISKLIRVSHVLLCIRYILKKSRKKMQIFHELILAFFKTFTYNINGLGNSVIVFKTMHSCI